jgi:hypothetical protein
MFAASKSGRSSAGGGTTDPYFPYVPLLLETTSTNGQQNNTFLDSSTNNFTITRNGTPTQGSITPYWPNGQWSNYFNGSTDYISAPSNAAFTFGTGDFTVEGWVYFNVLNATADGVFVQGTSLFPSSLVNTVAFATVGTTNFQIYANGTNNNFSPAVVPVANQWYHFAIVRNSGTTTAYLNGVSRLSISDSTNYTGTFFGIGSIYGTSGNLMNGYISNLRVVKGTAVYTANFTPPTSPLTAITNTSLLTCQSNRFIDNSTNNFTITPNGTPRVQAFQPFSPTASYTTALYGGSGYFNGSTDFLQTPSNSAVSAWSTDFTIESYIYLTSFPATTSWWTNSTSNSDGFTYCYIKSSGAIALGRVGVNESASAAGVIKLNQWQHIAVVRNSSAVTIYVNGVSVASPTTANLETATTKPLTIGGQFQSSGDSNFNGFISNFRVVKGTAVYTGNFTPPTLAPLTTAGSTSAASYSSTTNVNTSFASSATSLLTNMTNAGIYDAAVQNNVITVGDAQSSTTQSKWSPTSMKFDGTGDWLTMPLTPATTITSGNFTVEFWLNPTTVSTSLQAVVGTREGDSAADINWGIGLITNQLSFQAYNTSNALIGTITHQTTLSAGTWYYCALTRNGSTFTLYINSVASASTATSSSTIQQSGTTLWVGKFGAASIYSALNGYIQDLRITKGVARTITTPTAAFPTR